MHCYPARAASSIPGLQISTSEFNSEEGETLLQTISPLQQNAKNPLLGQMWYVTSIVIGKVYSEKLTKLSLEAKPDVCRDFRVAGGKMSRASSSGILKSIHSLATYNRKILH